MPIRPPETVRARRWLYLTGLAVYLAAGAHAFFFLSNDCDVHLYADYANACHSSSLQALYQTHNVEYPPLAVLLMTATRNVADALPAQEQALAVLPIYRTTDDFRRFKLAFRLEMAALYLLLYPLVAALLRKCCPDDSLLGRTERLLVLGAAAALLGPLLFDKLDLALAVAVLSAFFLLVSRSCYFWAYAALAVAVAYKVVPVALAPVWAIASLPDDALRGPTIARIGRLVAGRLTLLAVMILALIAPFCAWGGPGALRFLLYHSRRGIEFESSYAGLLAVLKLFGYPCDIHSTFGSADVRSSLSPMLANLAPVLVGLLLSATVTLLVAALARSSPPAAPASHFGRTRASLFAGFTLLVLLIVVVGNKVLSPQYLLWLLPLVPLAPLPLWPRRLFFAGFLAACALTRSMYPGLQGELLGGVSPLDPLASSGPTTLGACLLVGRSLLLVGMTGLLAAYLAPFGFTKRPRLTPTSISPFPI